MDSPFNQDQRYRLVADVLERLREGLDPLNEESRIVTQPGYRMDRV